MKIRKKSRDIDGNLLHKSILVQLITNPQQTIYVVTSKHNWHTTYEGICLILMLGLGFAICVSILKSFFENLTVRKKV
jgi:ABC-type glycerol-3-phosphate transport system permease component